jgi:hypothetical protein
VRDPKKVGSLIPKAKTISGSSAHQSARKIGRDENLKNQRKNQLKKLIRLHGPHEPHGQRMSLLQPAK